MAVNGQMVLRVFNVEHGACAMLHHLINGQAGRLAMIDSGCRDAWHPSDYIRYNLNRNRLDYLFITNADQDHMSDLHGLWDNNITVPALFRNPTYTSEQIATIKQQSGPLSTDATYYAVACSLYKYPVAEPFDDYMGGITATAFWNPYPTFKKTNDLSLVVFIQFGAFKILFPGDLERAGWLALLQDYDFCNALAGTDILVASHHGRESGLCPEIFNYFTPSAVVISDKPIEHETQKTVPDYSRYIRNEGVIVSTTGKIRHVLTTRRDGDITFIVSANGEYRIETEFQG